MTEPAITFLFTDIEGSTPLWDAHRDLMQQSVIWHEEILFTAVAAHNGRVVKTMGDGLYAVFDEPVNGVAAAVAGMHALREEAWPVETPIKVRMGLHTGPAHARGGDFYGPTVNKAARIMGVGHGEQIVVSGETVHDADVAELGYSFVELGEIRLRGVRDPASILQVVAPGLPDTFPPVTGLDIPSNLPASRTTFVGREAEMADLDLLLRDCGIVTLLGFGGTGKTRLAIEVAAAISSRYPDGVWFVDLAPITSDDLVGATVADVLSVTESPGVPIATSVAESLADSRTLIVLDNCEQVIDGVAELAAGIAAVEVGCTVLATSRTPLGVDGEHIFEVAPLSTGAHGPAVQVFVDRARAARRDFRLTDADTDVIQRIVACLDGIPLAVELAAARVRMMSLTQILEHLDDRFSLLTGGARTAEPRQQTLRALVEWSVDLLSEPERSLFESLSVFAEAFTVEAAHAVAAAAEADAEVASDPGVFETFDVLAGLVDQSLIRRTDADDELRFGMFETLRRYGAEQLESRGVSTIVHARHADHFFHRTADADALLKGPDQEQWQHRFVAEEADLLRALEWLTGYDPPRALRMASELARFWYRRGAVAIGRATTEAALAAAPTEPTEARSIALAWLGFFLDLERRRSDARPLIDEALAVGEAAKSARAVAQALNNLGAFANDEGALRAAVAHWTRAIEALDAAGLEWVTAPLFNLGYGLVELGELDKAEPIVQRLIDDGIRRGDPWTEAIGGLLAAYVKFGSGHLPEAERLAVEATAQFRDLDAAFHVAEAHILSASIAELAGDVVRARDEMAAARAAIPDTQLFDQAEALVLEARIALASGDVDGARSLMQRAAADAADEPNPATVAKVLHELARLAAANHDASGAEHLASASRAALASGDIVPWQYMRTEAADLGARHEHADDVDLADLLTQAVEAAHLD